MTSFIYSPIRSSILLIISVLLVVSCAGDSNSPDAQAPDTQLPTEVIGTDEDDISIPAESIVETNPKDCDALGLLKACLEFVQDKTFRISWQQSEGARFYRVLENPDGVSGFKDVSGNLDATRTNFDHRVALYARVNAQYLVQSCNDQGCVNSEPLLVTGTLDSAIGYFKASNTDLFDFFGFSVSLSADGNTLAVGAYGEGSVATGVNGNQDDNSAEQAGAVYVFARNGETWQQQAYIKPNNAESVQDDSFAFSVSLSADGKTLAVGAFGERSVSALFNPNLTGIATRTSGAVYVFVRNGETWQQQAYIKASNTELGDYFGIDVSLSADGNTLAVGARDEDSAATGVNGDQNDNSASSAGAAYVFVRNGDSWQQQAYIKASNTDDDDDFGRHVSLSADGNTLAVTAVNEGSAATGVNGDQNNANALGFHAGAVYVFIRNGEAWQQQAYVKASNTELGDFFGSSVSLSADGNTLAVTAIGEGSAATGINGDQEDNSARSGAVYVFVRNGETWQQQAYIKASNTGSNDVFGSDVNVSADGRILAVSAKIESSASTGINGDQADNSLFRAGAVYVFVNDGGIWQQQAYVKASNTGSGYHFGESVSLSADGNTMAVGAFMENGGATGVNGDQDDLSGSNSGAVYLY